MNENMKKVIDQEFSLTQNKEIIDAMIKTRVKKRSYKIFALVCLIVVMGVGGTYYMNQDSNDIYINHATQSAAKLDIAFENTERIDLKKLIVPNIDVNSFAIPKDLITFDGYKVYASKEHNQLLEYRLKYYESGDGYIRDVEINFSDKRQPARDLYVSGSGRSTFVNGVEMKLFGSDKNFYAMFEYKGYKFDIDVGWLTQDEFINLIKSIVK